MIRLLSSSNPASVLHNQGDQEGEDHDDRDQREYKLLEADFPSLFRFLVFCHSKY